MGAHRYGFSGLLTRFLSLQGVPKEDVDYKPPANTKPLEFSCTKGPTSHGTTLTMLECQDRSDEVLARLLGLSMLQLKVGGHPTTQ